MRFPALKAAFLATVLTFAAGARAEPPSLQERMSAAPEGSFEAGTFQALGALERLFQNFQRYGIGQDFGQFMGMRGRDLRNSQPEPRLPETLRTILETFLADLDAARGTLAMTSPETAEPFVVDLASVWFDINRDGVRSDPEDAARVLGNALPRLRPQQEMPQGPLDVRFDGADHAWLMAYTHAMSAAANMVLVFDPTPVFQDMVEGQALLDDLPTIENTFDAEALRARIALLEAEQDALTKRMNEVREARTPLDQRVRELNNAFRDAEDYDLRAALTAERDALQERLRSEPQFDMSAISTNQRFLRQQIRAARSKLPSDENTIRTQMQAQQMARFDEARNTLYALIKALEQQPDAARLDTAVVHWRAMLEQNRLFWRLVALETDDDREWVPNPQQTSALGVTVDQTLADAWQAVLTDGEALLDGRLLIRHPLLPAGTGVSVARWLENPAPLDLVGWLHGRAAYPYLARGPQMTLESWLELQRLTQGNGFAFAIFLN